MKTTFGRLFSTVVALILLSMTVIGGSFLFLVKNYLTNRTLKSLEDDANVISNLATAYFTDNTASKMFFLSSLDIASKVSGADAVICDAEGMIILCSDAPAGCTHQGMQISVDFRNRVLIQGKTVDTGIIENLYEECRYVVAVPMVDGGTTSGIVIVSSPMQDITDVLQKISEIFIVVSILVVCICTVFIVMITHRQSKPLLDIAKAASDFGHGDLTARVKTDGKNSWEIEELALSFNNMASSLQKSEYQRQEFVTNVSHELKTPMTTISGYVDGILDGTIPEEKQKYFLQVVSDESKRLSRLVRSMLDISRLQDQGGIPDEKKSRFDLEECIGQTLITYEQKINGKSLEVNVEMPEHPVYTRANQDYIMQVIFNLLDNAVKFSPEHGNLGVTVREGGNKAYVSVSNEGDTIPADELSMVFDRFHKLDKSRSMNREGWGLGLYIVKTIICSHGEDISVTSRNGKTEFTFTMPLVN